MSVCLCLCVCLYLKISFYAVPTWFLVKMKLLIGPRKVHNYFWEGYHHYPQRNHPRHRKKAALLKNLNVIICFKRMIKNLLTLMYNLTGPSYVLNLDQY